MSKWEMTFEAGCSWKPSSDFQNNVFLKWELTEALDFPFRSKTSEAQTANYGLQSFISAPWWLLTLTHKILSPDKMLSSALQHIQMFDD